MPKHILSFSGGKDSTAMYLLALEWAEKKGKEFEPVFADTQHEHEAVYEWIRTFPQKVGGPPIREVRADFSEWLVVSQFENLRFSVDRGTVRTLLFNLTRRFVHKRNTFRIQEGNRLCQRDQTEKSALAMSYLVL